MRKGKFKSLARTSYRDLVGAFPVAKTTWRKSDLMDCNPKYHALVSLLSRYPSFAALLANSVGPSEVDDFAKCAFNVFSRTKSVVELLRRLLISEFERESLKTIVPPGNGIASKLETVILSQTSAEYLKLVLGELVPQVLSDAHLDLEIDIAKLRTYMTEVYVEEDEEELISHHSRLLFKTAQLFIDRITDPDMIAAMPREIRAIAAHIGECAVQYVGQHAKLPLIGGFIMLRFLSPALVAPETWLPSCSPSPRARRNLVLITKLLQSASNGILFGMKETFMQRMNPFIEMNIPVMRKYLSDITIDPLHVDGGEQRPWSDMNPLSVDWEAVVTEIDMEDLFRIHRLLHISAPSLVAALTIALNVPRGTPNPTGNGGVSIPHSTPDRKRTWNMGLVKSHHLANSDPFQSSLSLSPSFTAPASAQMLGEKDSDEHVAENTAKKFSSNIQAITGDPSSLTDSKILNPLPGIPTEILQELLAMVVDLGPPPFASPWPRLTPECLKEVEEENQNQGRTQEKEQEQEEIMNSIGEDQPEMQRLVKAQFLYYGGISKDGSAIFYLIVNKIKLEHVSNINPLVSFIFKVMDEVVCNPYCLVIDMSWATISPALKTFMYKNMAQMSTSFSRNYKKNLTAVYIVHPNSYTRALLHFMRAFTSRKLLKKVIEIYNWKDLAAHIPLASINLPQSSKNFITRAYHVTKINSKGKGQHRLIKFTGSGVLNIEPKTRTIKNEKLLKDIELIAAFPESTEIQLSFVPTQTHRKSDKSAKKKAAWLNRLSNSDTDGIFRRYICRSAKERDMIIQDFFRVGFNVKAQEGTEEWRVVKVNPSGKRQQRLFKLTCDSLLNISNNKIKTEISFAGILSVCLDPSAENAALIQYKGETEPRQIFCAQSEEFVRTVRKVLTRFNREDECKYSSDVSDFTYSAVVESRDGHGLEEQEGNV